MGRIEYIQKQQKEHSRKVIGALPVHYPKEIFTALDVVPVEIWGPPGPKAGEGAGLLQTYICPIVRNALSFIRSGKADIVDGLLFPHTCDSMQGLATLVPDWLNYKKPVFRFQHPRGSHRPEALNYLRDEISLLVHSLENAFGLSMNPARLNEALRLHKEAEGLIRLLFSRRLHFKGSDRELYSLIRQGEFLRVEDHIPLLKKAIAEIADRPVHKAIPVMITGYVPEPMAIFDSLNAAGAIVVADDYAGIGRRIPRPTDNRLDDEGGIDAVIRRYLSLPPCSTKTMNPEVRIPYLLSLIKESGAQGVVIHEVKFCEPELFEIASIRNAFEAVGVPVLFLETELEAELSSRTITMIEAFLEVLRKKTKEGAAS